MSNNLAVRLAVLSLSVGAASAAHATIAFSNFGSGGSFNSNAVWQFSGPTASFQQITAHQFTAGATGQLTSIFIAATHYVGDPDIRFILYNDNTNTIGSQIGTWVATGPANNTPAYVGITFTSSSITLNSGQKYWLEIRGENDGNGGWFRNSIGDQRMTAFQWNYNGNYSYSTGEASAFQVEVVPEPASVILLSAGLGTLLCRRRARKSSV